MKKTKLSLEQYRNELGISLHTALRKSVDSDASHKAWTAIHEMGADWVRVLDATMDHLKHFEIEED